MGKSMAVKFAEAGAKVLASDVKEERLTALQSLVKNGEGKIEILKVDVSKEEDVKKMINECIIKFGSVDVLINNAGILDDFLPAAEVTNEVWNKVMSVNVSGPLYACREALQQMLKQGKGVIINISSIGGLNGSRAGVAYTTSKHALMGLTKNIGFQYAQKGIRCNAIAPGGVNTSIGENMHPNAFGYEKLSLGLATNPRAGEPDEIAEVALFLASDKSSFVNGSIVTADGGWTAY